MDRLESRIRVVIRSCDVQLTDADVEPNRYARTSSHQFLAYGHSKNSRPPSRSGMLMSEGLFTVATVAGVSGLYLWLCDWI
jgi:hypothetical protein